MIRKPIINNKHKICIIVEGFEEYYYLERLLELGVWSSNYQFAVINAKSASKIFPRYQDAYSNDKYELIVVFCDTDRKPYTQYALIKNKIDDFHHSKKASKSVVIFANPCTMQIILSHFGEISLTTQAKKVNASVIERLTGVQNYSAKEEKIKMICNKIYKRTYEEMKNRVTKINFEDSKCPSTNFSTFLDNFESSEDGWIIKINKILLKN